VEQSKKHSPQYSFERGFCELWKGDRSKKGAQFRTVAIFSDQCEMTEGKFQVYALEGSVNGIEAGKISGAPNPKLLFDGDYDSASAAEKKFQEIVAGAEAEGFKKMPRILLDEREFPHKA
jgi:hypothetical protein